MAGLGRGLGALLSASSRKAKNNNNASGDASSFSIVARSLAQVQGVKKQQEPENVAESKSTSKPHGQASALNNLLSPKQSATEGPTKSLKSRGLFKSYSKEVKTQVASAPKVTEQKTTTQVPQNSDTLASLVAKRVTPVQASEPLQSVEPEQAIKTAQTQASESVQPVDITPAQNTVESSATSTEQEVIPDQTFVQGSAFYESNLGSGIRPASSIPENYIAGFSGQDVYTPQVSGSSNLYIYEHTTYNVEFENGVVETSDAEHLVHGDGVSDDNYLATPYMSGVEIESGENLELSQDKAEAEAVPLNAESTSVESSGTESVDSVSSELANTAQENTVTPQDGSIADSQKLAKTLTQDPAQPPVKRERKTREQLRAERQDAAYRESPEARTAVQSGSAIDQSQLCEIEIANLQASVYQPRTVFSERSLNELADSIREHGLLEPLLVSRKSRHSKRFEIICGERRFRAAQIAGLAKVPCLVRELSDEKAYAIALIENIQREDLSPLEIARAYEQMMQECKYTQEVLAKSLGKSRSTIANTLRLLKLEPYVQQALTKGKIEVGHAKILLALTGKDQVEACKTVISNNLSVSATDVLVKDINKKLKQEQNITPNKEQKGEGGIPRFSNYERYLNCSLQGVKAKFVVKNEHQGKLTLSYTSDTELKYLLKILGIPAQNPNE